MSIISIIRFFRGTVRFTVRDGFLERFINLCAQNRVPVWDGRRQGSRYTACTTLAGSRRLPELAQRAGVILEDGRRGARRCCCTGTASAPASLPGGCWWPPPC